MMRPPELRLLIDPDELVEDGFAGAGGASTGIEMALGRSPDIAINHDAEALALIRGKCPFVGYDYIRRGANAPMLSMSTLLRCWMGSASEVPGASGGGSAQSRASEISMEEAEACVEFLLLADKAWGRDPEYARLWGALNLTIAMWLYRRVVLTQFSAISTRIGKDTFLKCLMSISASSLYLEWLVGRNMSERDRSPCFGRLKAIFAKRIEEETQKKPKLPAPPWAHHQNQRSYPKG